ncbi:hypothetical protein FGO68_gene4184 [Halteria grandinella]|uniref:Uncharacterized protein n=1 Tax=Halteria grandinella TaxID=5974 RepID=A0A8J8TAE8_HALGN|nr:hypothetical protein FGO68_gene4184 [Halteria grandinella]
MVQKAVSFQETPTVLETPALATLHPNGVIPVPALKHQSSQPQQPQPSKTMPLSEIVAEITAKNKMQTPQMKPSVDVEQQLSVLAPSGNNKRLSVIMNSNQTSGLSQLRPKPAFMRGPNVPLKKPAGKKVSQDIRSIQNDHPELKHLDSLEEDPNRVKSYNMLLKGDRE